MFVMLFACRLPVTPADKNIVQCFQVLSVDPHKPCALPFIGEHLVVVVLVCYRLWQTLHAWSLFILLVFGSHLAAKYHTNRHCSGFDGQCESHRTQSCEVEDVSSLYTAMCSIMAVPYPTVLHNNVRVTHV